nr:MAG TPA: hypothetical protein [Caudovirales sp. ct8Ze27]
MSQFPPCLYAYRYPIPPPKATRVLLSNTKPSR